MDAPLGAAAVAAVADAAAAAASSVKDTPEVDPNTISGAASTGFDEFLKTITSHYNHVIKETSRAPQGAKESFQAFTSAVNFNEPWIQCLLGFHVCYFLLFLFTRKDVDVQTIQFLATCVLVYISERLNTSAHQNWEAFSLQDYFDKQGVFVGVMYAGPLLLVGFAQLVNFLVLAAQALVVAKKLELGKQKYEGGGSGSGSSSSSGSADTDMINGSSHDVGSSGTASTRGGGGTVLRRSKRSGGN